MKNPMTAPLKDRIRLTSMLSTPTMVAQIRKKMVNITKAFFYILGRLSRDRNYFLTRKNRMGITEKFWNRMPACTILPMM